MKRIIVYLLVAIITLGADAAIKIKKETFKAISSQHNGRIVDDKGGLLSKDLTAMHLTWPTDNSGKQLEVAAVKVIFYGLPAEELSKIHFSASPDEIVRLDPQVSGGVAATLFVPLNTKSIKFEHPRFGSDSIKIEKELWGRTLYSVDAELEALHKVIITAAADPGLPVSVTLGDFGQKQSPATFEDIPNGKYKVVVGAGTTQKSSELTVDVTHTHFDYNNNVNLDLRHKKEVSLRTKGDKNTKWFVDDQLVGTGEDVKYLMPYGPHTVKAEVDADKYDERVVNVNEDLKQVFLSPQARKTLEFSGLYNGKPVETRVIEPASMGGSFAPNHQVRLLADKQNFTIALEDNLGHKGKTTLKIVEKMPIDHQIKLKSGRVMVWPWESDYQTAKWGFELSYVTKQINVSSVVDEEDSRKIETSWNGVWIDGFNQWLHGFRAGFHFQPAFKFGLGMYTGLFVEFYYSKNDSESSGYDEYKHYFEVDLSMPLHILYQFPLGRKIAVGFHTGPSFNWNLYGCYSDHFMSTEENNSTEEVKFGEAPYPKAFSMNWDFALWLRLGPVYLSGAVSKGMNDLGCFPDFGINAKSSMKKYVTGISFVF